MNDSRLADRYAVLLSDLICQITTHGKWVRVPALLDELHDLRRHLRANPKACATSRHRPPLHPEASTFRPSSE